VGLNFDLSLLTIYNDEKIKGNENLVTLAYDNLKILLNRIHKLPRIKVNKSEMHVRLPDSTIVFPKEKSVIV